jgi:ubiquitin-conjugating enzyme E2 M
MLKLKALATQKKEEEAKKEEAKKDETKNDAKPEPMAVDGSGKPTPPSSTGTQNVLSLRAKGGEKKKKGARQNAAELRAQKDLSEMPTVPGLEMIFPNPENIMTFQVVVTPRDGLYNGAKFMFLVNIPQTYPYDPPKVTCETLVYHPNIDWEGHVCLNILRQDWMPVLNLGSVAFGLMTLFLEPNPDDPLNKEAAKLMIEKPKDFEKNVKMSLRGGNVMGRNFPKLVN